MNAAEKLAQLLSSWEIPQGESARTARMASSEESHFWQTQAEAVALVQVVEAQLGAMRASGDDVSMFEAQVDEWYEAVFAGGTEWNKGEGRARPALGSSSLSLLRAFGLLVSKVGTDGAGSPTRRASLRACVNEAASLLDTELADWDKTEKAYIYSLVAAARRALETDSVLGERNIESLIHELIGALTAIALDLREAEGADSSRFKAVMNVVGKTGTVLRGILHDGEAIASIAVAVAALQAGTGH